MTSTKRLLREAAELRRQPTPHFHAAPLPTNLFEWHFTLMGPPAPSPFASGIYHGRIVLPPTYPLRPPSFRFLTPSGRFEVNNEICLSISGFHEETWQPAWGIRLALTALRSFMDEGAKGQVGGLEAGEEVRRRLAGESRGWRCPCGEGECAGKTNEEVLRWWWGECRGMEVDVEGEIKAEGKGQRKGEAVPREMKIGVRKETVEAEKQHEPLMSISQAEEKSAAQPSTTSILDPPRNGQLTSLSTQTAPLPLASATTSSSSSSIPSPSLSSQPLPPPLPSQSQPQQQQQQRQNFQDTTSASTSTSPSTQRSSPLAPTPTPTAPISSTSTSTARSPPPPPPSSRTTTHTHHHNDNSPHPPPASHSHSNSSTSTSTSTHPPPPEPATSATATPWLDKAISGIILALVVMVLRRAVASGDFYS